MNVKKEEFLLKIKNFGKSHNKQTLKKLFTQFGEVKSIKIMYDPETGKSTDVAFVKMAKPFDAKRAMRNLNQKIITGKLLSVLPAIPVISIKNFKRSKNLPTNAGEVLRISSNPTVRRRDRNRGLKALQNILDK